MFCIPPQGCCEIFAAVPTWLAYYEASGLFYVPSRPVFAYLSGIYRACSDYADRVSVITRTKNLVMMLACFFAAFRDGHSSRVFGYAQLNCHQAVFIVLLPTGISADLDIFGQYEVIRDDGLDPV